MINRFDRSLAKICNARSGGWTALLLAISAWSAALGSAAHAEPLRNPPTFGSDPTTHVLDLLMVAKAKPLSLPFGLRTTGWAYEVCPRPSPKANECPAGTGVQPPGGVRFALQKGDTIRLRLVNRLPVITDSKHCSEPGHADLVNNPTNLHTHGLIVEPHRAEGPRDAYGDYVFLEIKNPANHGVCKKPSATAINGLRSNLNLPFKICTASVPAGLGVPGALHPDTDVLDGAAEYAIHLPDTHPSGLYWFHPHLHGIAMNQISSGMSGVITIGKLADICTDDVCRAEVAAGQEQFLSFKDAQVEADGTLDDQQDAAFCGGSGDGGIAFNGSCLGSGQHPGGHWFHTVNGEVYPTIEVGPHGSIWRMLNSSPSRDYDLSLLSGSGKTIPMQILAVDGVTIEASAPADVLQQALGGKATTVPCRGHLIGVCVTHFEMMPSSRVELRVINPSPQPQQANLSTAEYKTGAKGLSDDWPKVNLASVMLAAPSAASLPNLNVSGARAAVSERGALGQPATVVLPGTDAMVAPAVKRAAMNAAVSGPVLQDGLRQTPVFAIDPALQSGLRKDPQCAPLAKGHRRRIYFGYPTPANFGLGYVEVDENGKEVPRTKKPVLPFDPSKATVCLPLEAGNKPAIETWELVNLTAEDHNFHMHQTKFTLVSNDRISPSAGKLNEVYVLHDNVPLRHGNRACDGTLATAEMPGSACHTTKVVVRIPFSKIGDFVYHCHIMEHEDGGMMARIRVVPGPDK